MAKNDNTLTYILFGAIILILVYVAFGGNQTYTPVNLNGTPNNQIGDTGQSYVDLSNLYAALTANSNASATCTFAGGQWFNTPTKVGCYNMAASFNVSDCTSPTVQSTMALCTMAHATVVCNLHNIGCYYPG